MHRSIAFYGAEGQEQGAVASALSRIVRVSLARLRVTGAYDLFVNFYNYMSIIGEHLRMYIMCCLLCG